MRVDAKKNLAKVAGELIKDPLQTQRELAEKTDIGLGTTNRAVSELEQSGTIDKDESIIRIAKNDLEDLDIIQQIERKTVTHYSNQADNGEYFKPSDLNAVSQIGERKQKRYSILMGDVTDKGGGDKLGVVQLPMKDE